MIGVCATLLASAIVASATKSLSLQVSAPSFSADVDDLQVVTTLVNTGDETLKLLNDPRTPLSSWATNTFVVTNGKGTYADFTGVKVRYIPEVIAASGDEGAFTVLAPGEAVDVTHEVGRYYNFTSGGTGAFSFEPVNVFNAIEEDGSLTTVVAKTKSTSVRLTGKLSSTKPLSAASLGGSAPSSGSLSKRATYVGCSTTRQTQIATAITDANTYATRSVSHLTSNPSGSTLQTTWFGTFATSRYNTVLTGFRNLVGTPTSWSYNCAVCTDTSLYAYVYPSTYGYVYLCGYFWNAPATGAGSRADTIIHEGSHFTRVLGTDDYAYGQSACKSLAISSPASAVYNADNYAFFSAAA